MPNQASERLARLSDQVMQIWEQRAIEEVAAAVHQKSLSLRDALPEFLGLIVTALSTTVNRTSARIKWDAKETHRVGKLHGGDRAASVHYTMDQLILEYHIFRQVICDVMEEEAPLSPVEREVIVCAIEQAVNDAATEFSEAHRDVQETLTHALAHDLRGPITATLFSAHSLVKKSTDAAQRTVAKRITASMKQLDLMIHDLLDASKIRAGEPWALSFGDVDLDLLLGKVAEETNAVYGDRIKVNSSGSAVGYWNESSIRRVVDNLVTNAIKFSLPESDITLSLRQNAENVEVSVHNIGDPIPDAEKSSMFLKYRRAREAEGKEGWGLGLTVVKGLAEAHGGHVEVESSEQAGTTFKIVLPWAAPEPPAGPPRVLG